MKTSGNKQYTIKYLKHVLKRNLPSLPEDVKPSIKDAIKEYLETDPIGNGVLLRKRLKEHRRIKVADDYRIVYRVNTVKRIVIPIPITRQTDGQRWKKSHNEVSKIVEV